MEFRILGPLEAEQDGRLVPLGGRKQRALLALLLLHANAVVPRDRLIDEIWGDEPPETARTALQVYVSQLRKALGGERIETRAPGYRVRTEPDALDLERFERLAAEGRDALAGGDAERSADALREALALWRGTPLAEWRGMPFAEIDAPFARAARAPASRSSGCVLPEQARPSPPSSRASPGAARACRRGLRWAFP